MDINQLQARQAQVRQAKSTAQTDKNQNVSAFERQSARTGSAADKCAYVASELSTNNALIDSCNEQALAIIANASVIDGKILMSNTRISEIDTSISSFSSQISSIQSNYDKTLGSFDSQLAKLQSATTQQIPVMENGVQKVDANGQPVFQTITIDNSEQLGDLQKQRDRFITENKASVENQIKTIREQIETLKAERAQEVANNKELLTSYNQALSDILLNQTASQSLKGLNIIISAALKEADEKYEKQEKALETTESKLERSENKLTSALLEEDELNIQLREVKNSDRKTKNQKPLDLTM